MDPVDEFKLSAALFIWLLAVVGGVAPLLSKRRMNKRASSILNMLAAGIFLASSCMHLLPDAQNNKALNEWECEHTAEVFLSLREHYDGDSKHCFMWANFFYGCGFLMVLLIEVFADTLQQHYNKVHGQEHETLLALASSQPSECVVNTELNNLVSGNEHPQNEQNLKDYGSLDADIHRLDDNTKEPHSHIHGIVKGNSFLALVVFIALSFHSVMEGMGMGASSSPAWDILVAILAHKSLAAFALVFELLHHNVATRQLLSSVAVFSLMTPTGILFGRLLMTTSHATPASGICAAFAGGTFLFVAIMEIIPQELQDPRYQVEKLSALLALWAYFHYGHNRLF